MAKIKTKIEGWRGSWLILLFESLSFFGIVFVVVAFATDLNDRQEERIARAWQLLTTKASGEGGKAQAIEYLNSQAYWLPCALPFCRYKERVSLSRIQKRKSERRRV